jgi:hypothetical protein
MPNKQKYDYFAFVVDNEVAVIIPINNENLPDWVAALSSDPKVVKLREDQKESVVSGWIFDGEEFSSPLENR